MAEQEYWVGSTGPFTYNDTDQYDDGINHATIRGPDIYVGAVQVVTQATIGNGAADVDPSIYFNGETNDGYIYWMEDEDYFQFNDDILMQSTEKIQFNDTAVFINSATDGHLDLDADVSIDLNSDVILYDNKKLNVRDSAIGIYSQADTYLDIFADGSIRIGDSSGGAPTNYVEVETDGDVNFVGGGGLQYGEINAVSNATETTITVAGTPVQVTIFDTNGVSNGSVTPDHTEDHITVGKAGHYFVAVSATVNSVAGAASKFEITVKKNNGASDVIPHMDRNLAGGGGESGVVSLSGIADLAANDTIEVWIENETNTQNYVVEDISLVVIQIGGT